MRYQNAAAALANETIGNYIFIAVQMQEKGGRRECWILPVAGDREVNGQDQGTGSSIIAIAIVHVGSDSSGSCTSIVFVSAGNAWQREYAARAEGIRFPDQADNLQRWDRSGVVWLLMERWEGAWSWRRAQ
jgi:hypothetical protein